MNLYYICSAISFLIAVILGVLTYLDVKETNKVGGSLASSATDKRYRRNKILRRSMLFFFWISIALIIIGVMLSPGSSDDKIRYIVL